MAVLLSLLARSGDTTAFNDMNPRAYIALMGLGFLVGTAGHIIKSKPMVAAGILMIFLATVLLPLGTHLSD